MQVLYYLCQTVVRTYREIALHINHPHHSFEQARVLSRAAAMHGVSHTMVTNCPVCLANGEPSFMVTGGVR